MGAFSVWQWLLILIALAVYFVPSIVAISLRHRQALAIVLLNIFLGWTLLGWMAALIWAALRPQTATDQG